MATNDPTPSQILQTLGIPPDIINRCKTATLTLETQQPATLTLTMYIDNHTTDTTTQRFQITPIEDDRPVTKLQAFMPLDPEAQADHINFADYLPD